MGILLTLTGLAGLFTPVRAGRPEEHAARLRDTQRVA
jgi:hypothetical protein